MADLFWPGDERADDLLTQESFLASMVRVEAAWLRALVDRKIADPEAYDDLAGLVDASDLAGISAAAEDGGNPVIPLVALLRSRVEARNPIAATWLHRGLTSQDVVDTALMLELRATAARLEAELRTQVRELSRLADQHRGSVMAGRTLTQHAVPVTFGLKAAMWLQGVLDAAAALAGAGNLPAQVGGAAGTMAASTLLAGGDPEAPTDLAESLAETLGLDARPPWHTNRGPVTRFGDALVGCTDAWGRIANDILTMSRPEIAELSEPSKAGRGGSSTMPQKVNPVLSVLVRRAALSGPGLAAQLHLAAAEMCDERADGSWHTEWATLAILARHTVAAASQTTELLSGLTIHRERMRATAEAAAADLLAESGADLGLDAYLGASDRFIDAVLDRAAHLEDSP